MKLGTTILSVSLLAGRAWSNAPACRRPYWQRDGRRRHGRTVLLATAKTTRQTKAGKTKKVRTNTRGSPNWARKVIKSTNGIEVMTAERMKPYAEKLTDAEIGALTDYVLNTLK
jgi:hypothetical protein